MIFRAILLLGAFLFGGQAKGAEILLLDLPVQSQKVIAVRGYFENGDDQKFADVAIRVKAATVVLSSNGGSLIPAIEIGRAIRLKGFETFVPAAAECTSACALAWLAGRERSMSASARVGFHAAFTEESGVKSITSAGNALVGAYLNQLGLPAEAVVYITSGSPDEIRWLTLSDARSHGIYVKLYEPAAVQKALSQSQRALTSREENPLERPASGKSARLLFPYEDTAARLVRTFAMPQAVTWVAFSPDGRTIFSAGGGRLKSWNLAMGSEKRDFGALSAERIALSPDGRSMLVSKTACHSSAPSSSPGYPQIQVNCTTGSMELVDTAGGGDDLPNPLGLLTRPSFMADSSGSVFPAFSADGRLAYSVDRNGTVKIWDVAKVKSLGSFETALGLISAMALAPEKQIAFLGNVRGQLEFCDLREGRNCRPFSGHKSTVHSVAISADGRFGLSGSADNTLKMWDAITARENWGVPPPGKEVRTFVGHLNDVYSVALTSDGKYVVSGSSDRTLRLWDATTGRELHTFSGHAEAIYSVAISPDNRLALSGSGDETLKLWDISEWTQPLGHSAAQ